MTEITEFTQNRIRQRLKSVYRCIKEIDNLYYDEELKEVDGAIKVDNEILDRTTLADDITNLIMKTDDVLFSVKNIFALDKETITAIKFKIINCNKQLEDIQDLIKNDLFKTEE